MHLERMLKWQQAVIDMPDYEFQISRWAEFYDDGTFCTVCAGGKAAQIFEGEGLNFVCDPRFTRKPIIYYDGQYGTRAIAEFFDIYQEQAKMITDPSFYSEDYRLKFNKSKMLTVEGLLKITKEACIARIDQVIMDNLWRAHVAKQLITA